MTVELRDTVSLAGISEAELLANESGVKFGTCTDSPLRVAEVARARVASSHISVPATSGEVLVPKRAESERKSR